MSRFDPKLPHLDKPDATTVRVDEHGVLWPDRGTALGKNIVDLGPPDSWHWLRDVVPTAKRGVSFKVMIYDIVGTHYYVHGKVDGDYIWDADDQMWRRPWIGWQDRERYPEIAARFEPPDVDPMDDDTGEGDTYSGKFDTSAKALAWIRAKIAERFPPDQYHVLFQDNTDDGLTL